MAAPRQSSFPMREVPDALGVILVRSTPKTGSTEGVSLRQCVKRVLAEDVLTPMALPPFRASIMDGYAMAEDDGPGEYAVKGRIHAGEMPNFRLAKGEVAYVTTGAPVPEGTAFVTKIEATEQVREDGAPAEPRTKHSVVNEDEKVVRILQVSGNVNIREVGSDLSAGECVVEAGTLITPAEVGLIASSGVHEVQVVPKVRVGVFSTGDELVDPSADAGTLPPGTIYDSNRYTILSLVESEGCVGVDLGIVKDSTSDKEATLQSFFEQCDIVVSSGGVSMGETDWVKDTLVALNFTIEFGRLMMKPGKPTTYATRERESGGFDHFFGVPGNPVSALVTSQLLLLPAIRRMQGLPIQKCLHPEITMPVAPAAGKKAIFLDPERPEYHRVHIRGVSNSEGSGLVGHSTGTQRSSMLRSCRGANGLAYIPQGTGARDPMQGTRVLVTGELPSPPLEGTMFRDCLKDLAAAGLVTVPPPEPPMPGKDDHGADCECCKPAAETLPVAAATQRPSGFAPLASIPLPDMEVKVALLIASDRASAGVYEDKSGPAIAAFLAEVSSKYVVVQTDVIQDEADMIQEKVKTIADGGLADVVLTSGGTGFGPRDHTPEAVKACLEREAPGVAMALLLQGTKDAVLGIKKGEMIAHCGIGLQHTPFAVMSRPVVGTRKRTLIATLPGSPKAIKENMHALVPLFPKIVRLLRVGECDHVV